MLKKQRLFLSNKKKYLKLEYQKNINKFMSIYLNNNKLSVLNFNKYTCFLKKKKSISNAKIKSICALTNRTKSVNNKFNISRIIFREMLCFGIFPGFKKAVW